MFDKIVNCTNLPTLPAVAVELLEKTRDPDVQLADISKLVMRDQGLASRILRTVNSSFYGLSQPCTTIDRALGLLGLKAIKSLVLGFSMVKVTKGVDNTSFNLEDYWRRTICTATAARIIASITKTCDPDEAFTAGLFVDMGMLASFVAAPKDYEPILDEAPKEHSKLVELEATKLGFTHADIGAAMAEKWRMSDPVIKAIRFHHSPNDAEVPDQALVKSVCLGQLAAETILSENPAQPMADLMISTKEWFGKDNDEVENLLNKISDSAVELADILDQKVGEIPDAQQILARANDQLVEQQIAAQRETEQLQQKAQALEVQTITDPLTGAANRKRFDSEILRLFNETRSNNKPLAVLFVDADKFKSVNDTHGHQAGDVVLVELARRMMNLVGKLGSVCRYGGEEFAILIPHASADKATRFGELLRKAIADKPFDLTEVDGAPDYLPITVSIGVSASNPSNPELHTSANNIVLEADKAVYAAKQGGRNCVKLYSSEMQIEKPQTIPPKAAPTSLTTGSTRVLLVEDDPISAKYLRESLVAADANVTLVGSCADALELLQRYESDSQSKPDLIICEHDLPDGTSGELIRAAKANSHLQGVQVMVVTSMTNANISAAARAAGADAVYLKSDIADALDHWGNRILKQSGNVAAA